MRLLVIILMQVYDEKDQVRQKEMQKAQLEEKSARKCNVMPGGDERDRKIKKWPGPHGENMTDALSTGEAELETSLIYITRAT